MVSRSVSRKTVKNENGSQENGQKRESKKTGDCLFFVQFVQPIAQSPGTT
jgi:hypothetical protein